MLNKIKEQISRQCAALGRSEPELIAVSKRQPNAVVSHVLEQGQRIFGENQVQEAQGKWPEFREQFGAVELHLLGPLQTNKVNACFGLFDVIHSLDRLKLAKKLAQSAQSFGECPKLFVQVNTGAERQKSGVLPNELESFLADLRPLDLPVIGLMCIPPFDEDARSHFKMLRELANTNGLESLSMGMSGDYDIAIEEGATHIRVGSAIFGQRTY